jgi:hypothetical protein
MSVLNGWGGVSDRNGRVRVANVFCLVFFCRTGVDAMCTIYLTAEEFVEERKHVPADEYDNTQSAFCIKLKIQTGLPEARLPLSSCLVHVL